MRINLAVLLASGPARVKIRLIYGHFQVEVPAWWKWFLTTILDGSPTEIIAVTNRSHNFFKRCSDSKKFHLRSNWPLPVKGAADT